MAYINYILLDANRMEGMITEAKVVNSNYRPLLLSRSYSSGSDYSPYLFSYEPLSEFSDWYMEKGWGKGWGIMLRSHVSPPELIEHCRKFLHTVDEANELYFRYFDPRVLDIFLPTCNQSQLKEFFGPIDYFMIESPNVAYAELLWLDNYTLKRKMIDVAELERRLQAKVVDQLERANLEASDEVEGNTNFNIIRGDLTEEQLMETLTTVESESSNKEKWSKFFFED
jgi:hypothetical protein